MLLRTWMATIVVFTAACRAPPLEGACPGDRARALAVAMRALARSRDTEAPPGILIGVERDSVCPSGRLERRVRCHLDRPTVQVASSCARGGWTFTIYLPELSDHVHRARVWRRHGALAASVESEN